ncbi:MAG: extracellular solute-binding protein [Arachnia sp.]
MLTRKTAVLAGATALALAVAGCAGGASKPNPTTNPGSSNAAGGNTVTFRSWSPIEQTTKQMIEAFTADNAGVTIDSAIFNYPEYLVDLQTRAGSNTMPDVMGLQPGALTQQYRSNLMPLQECAAKIWGADWEKKFFPIGLEQARLGNPEGDENYYTLPLLTQTVNMWANTKIFEETNQQIPKTWDELVAVTKAMAGKDYAPFLLPAKDSWLRNVVFLQIANNINPGLPYRAESGEDSWTNPDIVKALEYWQKLFTDGIAQSGAIGLDAYPSGANQFEAGNAAMIPLGAWWIQQSDPTKADIPELSQGMQGFMPFLFPTIPGGAAESQLVGGMDVGLGISKNTANPDLACKVLTEFIAGKPAQKLINTMNDVPAVEGLTPETFTSDRQKEIWELFMNDWLPNTKYSRYFKSPEMDQAVGDALAAVATGDKTPADAAADIQKAQDALG